ncbi:MAG: ATP-binding protein, partial [Myxococcota bacterium]
SSAGATVDLTDDGPGVPTALTDTLFEPFVTGRPRSGPHPGTGLGLAIARRIVERHHGRLEYRPAPTGAHFSMWLPVRQPMLAPNPPSDAKPGTRDQT